MPAVCPPVFPPASGSTGTLSVGTVGIVIEVGGGDGGGVFGAQH